MPRMRKHTTCKHCGEPLSGKQVKYCCKKCYHMCVGEGFKYVWPKDRPCKYCGNTFTARSGVHAFCSDTCKGAYKYSSGKVTTATQYARISGNWYNYFTRLMQIRDRKRTMSARECVEILEKQNYRCALTGVELTCIMGEGIRITNASIDRLDVGGPYTKENVQIVCKAVNSWRNDVPLEDFIVWCNRVARIHPREV